MAPGMQITPPALPSLPIHSTRLTSSGMKTMYRSFSPALYITSLMVPLLRVLPPGLLNRLAMTWGSPLSAVLAVSGSRRVAFLHCRIWREGP